MRSNPAAAAFLAMGAPMFPRPIQPILVMMVVLTSVEARGGIAVIQAIRRTPRMGDLCHARNGDSRKVAVQ
ncbi:hypothetical protein GCM10022294_07120 [Dietzia aurantiaca]